MNVIDRFRNRPSKWARVSLGKTKLILTINGYRWEGWQSVIELEHFIIFEIRNKFISWQLHKGQDPEGKWTMKLILEVKSGEKENLKNLVEIKAREIYPGINIKFEEI